MQSVDLKKFYASLKNPKSIESKIIKLGSMPGRQIYRGFTNLSKVGVYYMDPTSAPERTSANTMNYYTWWIDNVSKKWKSYPKRSKSFICGSSESIAGGYGSVYQLIPVKPTSVGICSYSDFWDSFGQFSPEGINDNIASICHDLSIPIKIKSVMDFVKLLQVINIALKDEKNRKIIDGETDLSEIIKKNQYDVLKAMDYLYDPVRYKFKLLEWPNTKLPVEREIWFSAPCYAVHTDIMDKIRFGDQ